MGRNPALLTATVSVAATEIFSPQTPFFPGTLSDLPSTPMKDLKHKYLPRFFCVDVKTTQIDREHACVSEKHNNASHIKSRGAIRAADRLYPFVFAERYNQLTMVGIGSNLS